MKFVAVTQRVEIVEPYGERRDALDQKWAEIFDACDIVPVLVPNSPNGVFDLLQSIDLSGLLLSGGNNLISCGGDAPERDETETRLFSWARECRLPVIGVCRGMQVIQNLLGVRLERVSGHVSERHRIDTGTGKRVVNSFHDFGATDTVEDLSVWAKSEDGVIEAVRHKSEKILGMMWHPEREAPFESKDIDLFSSFYEV